MVAGAGGTSVSSGEGGSEHLYRLLNLGPTLSAVPSLHM